MNIDRAANLYDQAIAALAPGTGSRDFNAAKRLLVAAADAGSGDAARLDIALTANGTWGAPDWASALDMLKRLASNDVQAGADLRLLDAMQLDDAGNPKAGTVPMSLNKAPSIGLAKAFVTPAECAAVAAAGTDLLGPSVVVDPVTGRDVAHPVRTSAAAVIGPGRESLPIRAINLRIAALSQMDVGQGEPLSLLHYAPGQEYRPHMDTIAGLTQQRVKTVILYLNGGYQGGETVFTSLGLSVRGSGGDALIFDNVDAEGQPEPRSRHAGLPVTAGTKWIATRWIRSGAFNPWLVSAGRPITT